MEYPKVLTLGSYQTERALIGPVAIQEKIDGSQFRFWITPTGDVEYGSHHRQIHIGENYGMFKEAIEHLESIKDKVIKFQFPAYFFCEYLAKPKQNCLKYNRVPRNNLILFDAYINNKWIPYFDGLEDLAYHFDIERIPQFDFGETTVDGLREYFTRESILGGEKIEGVVVKNYNEDIMVGGNLRPLFVKLVRSEFKERNSGEHAGHKQTLEEWMGGFKTEARWQKAIQTLQEEGKIEISPRDIGPLFVQVHKDISEEEKGNISHYLYRHFIGEILRRSTAGLAEWYKEKLVKEMFENGKQEEIKS